MNFLLIAILASNIYGLIADADTDYNHVNPDGSYAFGSVILCVFKWFMNHKKIYDRYSFNETKWLQYYWSFC